MRKLEVVTFIVSSMLLLATVLNAEEKEVPAAKLLFSKELLNKIVVQDMDVAVKYTIYNIGNGAAYNVKFYDNGFPKEYSVLLGGQVSGQIDKIPPQSNVSHVVVAKLTFPGFFNFTSAIAVYNATENAEEETIVISSSPGEKFVVSFKEYDRRFSPHTLDWITFAIMALPCVLIPLSLWHSSKSKYEQILKQKKEKPAAKET